MTYFLSRKNQRTDQLLMADLGLCFLHMQRAVFLIVQVIYIDDRINSLKIPRSYNLYHIKAFLLGFQPGQTQAGLLQP